MALNDVKIIRGTGGLGRPLPGEDHICGLVVYKNILPAGFAGLSIAQIKSLAQIESYGVVEGDANWGVLWYHVREFFRKNAQGILWVNISTIPTGAYTFSEVQALQVASAGKCRQIGVYVDAVQFTTTHVTALQTIAATLVTLFMPCSIVLCPNIYTAVVAEVKASGTITVTNVGASTNTLTAKINGVAIGLYTSNGTDTPTQAATALAADINSKTLTNGGYTATSAGAVVTVSDFAGSGALGNAKILTGVITGSLAVTVVTLTGGVTAQSPLLTLQNLADLTALNSERVSVCIGEDGSARGYTLRNTLNKSIGCIGALLGVLSLAKVNENIGWVGGFPLSEGSALELDKPAFASGIAYIDTDATTISSLNTKGYIFARIHVGLSGSYFNDSFTCTATTSDYFSIENKISRALRVAYLPHLNEKTLVRSGGRLTNERVSYYQSIGDEALRDMIRAGEISQTTTVIDPEQDVLTTSKLIVGLLEIATGILRNIEITSKFTK